MHKVYEELDEVKAELEKLKGEYRVKAELAESLKRAQSEQLVKTREANHKLEKLAWELNGKEDEISAANQINEELKSCLKDKEDAIKHLASANSKLRLEYGEKLLKCEEENKALGLALDEANAKNMDQEKKIGSLVEEIAGVKRLLTVLQKKSSEKENKVKASKELQLRDDVFLDLEEKNRSFEEKLKWRNEQFGHLQEAHEKLRRHFQEREKEWEKEKAMLIDDLSSLQSNLESQIRISEDLQSRLHMTNQALAHEEGKRRLLEVQLLDFKNRFDNVCDEYEEAKLKIESLSSQRDQEIATLRGLLSTKETLYKEMQYQFNKLELEKQELTVMVKELQEAQIHEAGKVSSSSKLWNRLKCLEKEHKECSRNLKAKEAEWRQLVNEELKVDLNKCRSALKSKDNSMNELGKELEALKIKLELQNEENSLLLLVLKSEFSEAQHRLANNSARVDLRNKKLEETVSILAEELDMKKETLVRVQKGDPCAREQEHNGCSRKLKAKEAEWQLVNEELKVDLSMCRSSLKSKDSSVNELSKEMEALKFELELQNEENSLLLLVLKSEFSEAQLRLADNSACVDLRNKELEEFVSVLAEELDMKKETLVRVQKELEEEREKAMVLARKLKSIEEEQLLPLHRELDRIKGVLKESTTCQLNSEERVMHIQSDLETVRDALDRANEELYEKFCEVNEAEFELQIWKSIAEQFKANIQENYQLRRDVEASLLAQVDVEVNLKREKESLCHQLEEKDRMIDNLQQQIVGLGERIKFEESMPIEKEILVEHSDEKASEGFQKEMNCLVQELINKELEAAILAQVEKNHQLEKETLSHLVEEKDKRIYDLQQLVSSLEQEFETSTCSFSLQLTKLQMERNSLHESWEKIKTVEVLKEVEIQEKNLIITELEHDLSNLQQRAEEQEKNLLSSGKKNEEIEVELEAKQLEIYKLERKLEEKQLSSETMINMLHDEKVKILEDIGKFSNLSRNAMELLSDKIEKLPMEDMQLMESLERIVKNMENNEPRIGTNDEEDEYDSVKENINTFSSPLMKKVEAICDERSPLRALNN